MPGERNWISLRVARRKNGSGGGILADATHALQVRRQPGFSG
ncbi:hypothetical protein B4098_2420 [Heyndrickxia coagulans]|uniref:Uncharacterized protein n=1 Tax=Heyndrickxia coagulans TaxID=1398 RepID=A0A150JNQ4_HEYCO|nr:hypothetical protein B4098_2420 [Heyndrickxia coagulans]